MQIHFGKNVSEILLWSVKAERDRDEHFAQDEIKIQFFSHELLSSKFLQNGHIIRTLAGVVRFKLFNSSF